jgi:small subunit ribosomal protein S9
MNVIVTLSRPIHGSGWNSMADETPETTPADEPNPQSAETEQTPADAAAETPAAEASPAETSPDATGASTETASATEEPATEEAAAVADDAAGDDTAELTLGSGDSASEEEPEVEKVAPVIRGRVDKFGVAMGTGRRKTSVARVRIKAGDGKLTINGRSLEGFFCVGRDRKMVTAPLRATEQLGKVDVWVRVNGGGTTGQTGAIVLGIARALQVMDPELHLALAGGGFLTRDSRMVERKKYGRKKARKSFQFSKR